MGLVSYQIFYSGKRLHGVLRKSCYMKRNRPWELPFTDLWGACISGTRVKQNSSREQQNIEWYFIISSSDAVSLHVLLSQLITVEHFNFEFPV